MTQSIQRTSVRSKTMKTDQHFFTSSKKAGCPAKLAPLTLPGACQWQACKEWKYNALWDCD
jgi:hypothetical protein